MTICPFTALDAEVCSFDNFRPSTKEAFDKHVEWHLDYEAEKGTDIIKNEDGTYSLREETS